MLEKGFVKFDRKITSWRWYCDANTARLFFHLVITANYKDRYFEDVVVKRGQRIVTISGLAKELNLSERNIRTALNHLKTTGEVTNRSTSKYTVITINNYNCYQEVTNHLTNDRQTSDKRLTNDRQQCKKDKERYKKDEEYTAPPGANKDSYSGGYTDF